MKCPAVPICCTLLHLSLFCTYGYDDDKKDASTTKFGVKACFYVYKHVGVLSCGPPVLGSKGSRSRCEASSTGCALSPCSSCDKVLHRRAW